MAVDQKVLINSIEQSLMVVTNIDRKDLLLSYDQKAFLMEVHRNIAIKVADAVFKQIAPAIDEALKNIKFEE